MLRKIGKNRNLTPWNLSKMMNFIMRMNIVVHDEFHLNVDHYPSNLVLAPGAFIRINTVCTSPIQFSHPCQNIFMCKMWPNAEYGNLINQIAAGMSRQNGTM